jgi:hypothetical protein
MKFKEGDILEFDGNGPYSAVKGAKAIFKEYTKGYSGEEYIKVEWIRDGFSGNQEDGNYYESQFTKVEDFFIQKENRIFEENKKVMKIDFKEGVQRVIDLLEQSSIDFEKDMLQDIVDIARDGEGDSLLEDIEELIESIRINKRFVEEAIDKLENVGTLQEVLKAMRNTVFEEEESTVLKAFFDVNDVTFE